MNDPLQQADQDKLAEAVSFYQGFDSVVLGSVTARGRPHSSYAPFVSDDGMLYIYVSALAAHASTLKNGYASAFFIEDETQAKTLFARRRLTLDCEVSEVAPDHPNHERILDLMQHRHGSTVKLLRSLPDFILFRLAPSRASFVTGFGAAFEMSAYLAQLTAASE